ncbi:MAG: response regulator transcription factor [Saccharofermentans sp.]|nr:response regulator transcription factor [Saccharofermentans sp.]
MKTIFIVDDDVAIGDMEQTVLEKNGYKCVRAFSGTEAVLHLKNGLKPDLILLDLMLPGLTGEEVLPKIKELIGNTPVIVVSAKIDVDSKVNMLMEGAADYMTKPFDTRELLARIEVRLKMSEAASVSSSVLTYEEIRLDDEAHTVTVSDTPVSLTRTEYGILRLLMSNSKIVVTKSQIIDRISSETEDCTESSLKTHVSHLRNKLKAVSGKDYIEAVWGIGFKLKA